MIVVSSAIVATTVIAATTLTALLTGIVRQYALSSSILDQPNERSSHTIPTARGGGLAIAAVAFAGIAAGAALGIVSARAMAALIGGGLLIAIVGWVDDRRGLGTVTRFAAHVAAAIWAVACLGAPTSFAIGSWVLSPGIRFLLAVVGIVWSVNLYNFMDGIDGLAGAECVTGMAAIALLSTMLGATEIVFLATLLASVALGFTVWNWSPAKIFMGDVGSGLLGFLVACLALRSERTGGLAIVAWLMVFGVFVFDATTTLIRRVLRGERWYAAHRSHAYQRLTQAGWSHASVTLGVIGVNVLLVVLAAFTVSSPGRTPLLAAGALVLLAGAYGYAEWRAPMFGAAAKSPTDHPAK